MPQSPAEQQALLNVATAAAKPNNAAGLAVAEQQYRQTVSNQPPPVVPAPTSVQVNQPGKVIPNPLPTQQPQPSPTQTPPPTPSQPTETTSKTTLTKKSSSSLLGTFENDLNKVGGDIASAFSTSENIAKAVITVAPIAASKVKGPTGVVATKVPNSLNTSAVKTSKSNGVINTLESDFPAPKKSKDIFGLEVANKPVITPVKEITIATIAAVALPAVAPELGIAGLTTKSVLIGEGAMVGVNQGFQFYSSGLNPSTYAKYFVSHPEQEAVSISTSAAEGAGFAVASGAIFQGIGVAGKALDIAMPKGAAGVATSIFGRAAVNAGLTGGTSAVLSGGNAGDVEQGLAFGAIFSLGMEPLGYISAKLPLPKIGSASIPFTEEFEGETYEGEATMKGLFLAHGPNAQPLITTWENMPDDEAIVKATIGENIGYQPKTAIEAEATRQFMLRQGADPNTIQINREAVDVVSMGKGVRSPKLFEDFLPKETGTSTEEEVSSLKDYIIQNTDVVEKVFGKFGAIPQENPELGYEIVDPQTGEIKSSMRITSDIDIQLKSGITQDQALKFAQGVYNLYGPEAGATLEPGKTLINTIPVELRGTDSNVAEEMVRAHAVDIHTDFDTEMNPQQPGAAKPEDMTWGIKIQENPRLIEEIPTASIKEQVAAKFGSVFNINEEGEFEPVPHRIKDIPDFLTDAQTLIEQVKNPITQARGTAEIQDIADYFGIGNIKDLPPNPIEEYVMVRPSAQAPSMTSRGTVFPNIFNLPISNMASKSSKAPTRANTFSLNGSSRGSTDRSKKPSSSNLPNYPSNTRFPLPYHSPYPSRTPTSKTPPSRNPQTYPSPQRYPTPSKPSPKPSPSSKYPPGSPPPPSYPPPPYESTTNKSKPPITSPSGMQFTNFGFPSSFGIPSRATSVKRIYPVQTPEQLLGLPKETFNPKRNSS